VHALPLRIGPLRRHARVEHRDELERLAAAREPLRDFVGEHAAHGPAADPSRRRARQIEQPAERNFCPFVRIGRKIFQRLPVQRADRNDRLVGT
jgi:hypothetical protein